MSDFDKEAEREKLREKYEQEEERRKTTEQMSELLLKGATMTNAHCSDCGDPIFRYDGQEFCPTCQKPVDRGSDGQAADGEEGTESGESPANNGKAGADNIEVTDPSDEASVRFGSDAAGTEDPGTPDEAAETANQAAETPERGGQAPGPSAEPSPDRSAEPRDANAARGTENTEDVHQVPSAAPSDSATPDQAPAGVGTEATGTRTSESVGDHLDQAQVILARTVERHARLAAAADSPRETRDHLETARDAAETLDATGY